jgi:HK97 family phage portal protein
VRSPLRSLIGAFTASAPVPFVGTGQEGRWGGRAQRGVQLAALDALEASAALYSIVNRTSTAVAKETWHMHRAKPGSVCGYKDQRGACEAEDVEQVVKHPALTVINKPNGFYTRQELAESGQQHVDLTGEGWLIISRLGKIPYELWVARPDRMIVVTDRKEFLVGYLYIDPDGVEIPIRREDVLSIRMPNPKNPYRGLGPVQSVLLTIEGGNFSAEWNTNFFRNGARPGGIVKLDRRMSDTDFEQLVERFNFNHQGVRNANRTGFLEEGEWIDVKPMSITDMQFVETANLNRDTILLAFGMSKFAVGVVEDVNRATADASAVWFGETATIPRLDRWQGMWNNDFLPQFPGYDPRLSLVYSNPIPADREAARADKSAAVVNFVALKGAGVEPAVAAEVAGLPAMAIAPPPPAPELPPQLPPGGPAVDQPLPQDEPPGGGA